MSPNIDTIVALATPPGRGGISVIRISGLAVTTIAKAMLGRVPQPRHASYGNFGDLNGEPLDKGIALFFPGPRSFTGEDMLELQGHGGPVVSDLLLQRVVELGARLAGPGEFSERAFLNGKIDLAQAEAIADLINSGSAQAARCALRSLAGEFSHRVHAITESVIQLRTYVEAAIDFPEEEIDFLDQAELLRDMRKTLHDTNDLLVSAEQGRLLRDGLHVVLLGAPNAGKSSLLNHLSQSDRAIVSAIPGTTRDILEQSIQIDGLPLQIIDTAGLRHSGDEIEQEGVRRARRAATEADLVLVMVDDSAPAPMKELLQDLPTGTDYALLLNKIDLTGRAPGLTRYEGHEAVALSLETMAGVATLRQFLLRRAGFRQLGDTGFIARRRHLDALAAARRHMDAALKQLTTERAGELVAEELRQAQQQLGAITGKFTSDDLLGRIFASFCIGK
jgi:tRNA modification GTPase